MTKPCKELKCQENAYQTREENSSKEQLTEPLLFFIEPLEQMLAKFK